jgi:hypothetical protein
MPTDIFSVSLSNDQRVLALLSQTVGLLTDADFNTEYMASSEPGLLRLTGPNLQMASLDGQHPLYLGSHTRR